VICLYLLPSDLWSIYKTDKFLRGPSELAAKFILQYLLRTKSLYDKIPLNIQLIIATRKVGVYVLDAGFRKEDPSTISPIRINKDLCVIRKSPSETIKLPQKTEINLQCISIGPYIYIWTDRLWA